MRYDVSSIPSLQLASWWPYATTRSFGNIAIGGCMQAFKATRMMVGGWQKSFTKDVFIHAQDDDIQAYNRGRMFLGAQDGRAAPSAHFKTANSNRRISRVGQL